MVDSKATLTESRWDVDLRVVREDLLALPLAETHWADSSIPVQDRERDRSAFYHEWDDTVDRFEALAAAFDAQRLPEAPAALFRELVALVRNVVPTLRRLRLREPDTELLQRLVAGAARQHPA
jgi:hypothetical protein